MLVDLTTIGSVSSALVASRYSSEFLVVSGRLPLDEKLFERDLQAALQLSKQSTEDDNTVKAGQTNG